MELTLYKSELCKLANVSEMNQVLKLANEKLQEGLEDQLRSRRAQTNSHLAKAESDAELVRKATDAKIETLRKKYEETIQERKAVIDLKAKVELSYRKRLKRLKEIEATILRKQIENEDREDTSPEYKQTKLDNFISTLCNQACKEFLDAVYKNESDNAKEMRLQMAGSTFHYYTLRMKLFYLDKSRAIPELGTALDLDDNAPLCKVISDSLPCLEGIDVESATRRFRFMYFNGFESAILRQNFDGSAALELRELNYTDNSDWLLDLLSQSGSKFDFVKINSKEGFSALKADFFTALVTACLGCPDAILDKVPRYISIGFCPSLDWESELFELFKPLEQSMTTENRGDIVSGALGCVSNVKYNGEAMKINVYFGFEEKEKPFKKINCFEMSRIPESDNDTSLNKKCYSALKLLII